MAKSGTSSGQPDLWSDVPLVEVSGGWEWYYLRSGWPLVRHIPLFKHLVARSGTSSGQPDLWSDVPPSRGIWWPRVILLQVRLTFGQPYPWERHLVAKSGTTSGQADFWLDKPSPPEEASRRKCASTLGYADYWSDISPVEASSGQEWYYFGAAWHLVSLWVRLAFVQMYLPSPMSYPTPCPKPLPQVEASNGQEWYYCVSAGQLVSLCFRLTFGQKSPCASIILWLQRGL